jgi:hypothetical protein
MACLSKNGPEISRVEKTLEKYDTFDKVYVKSVYTRALMSNGKVLGKVKIINPLHEAFTINWKVKGKLLPGKTSQDWQENKLILGWTLIQSSIPWKG